MWSKRKNTPAAVQSNTAAAQRAAPAAPRFSLCAHYSSRLLESRGALYDSCPAALSRATHNMRWATLSLLVLGVCAAAHLQTPLFAPRPHAASKSSKGNGDFPGFGAPSLSGGFAKLAASEIDIRAAAAFAPTVRSFDELSESAYSVLTHPAYPRHSVRVKKSKFCDGSVECVRLLLFVLAVDLVWDSAYTGYIDVEARHLFFYFFKSRGNWTEDDIIFWTNGGPGCSSAMGLFMELGAFAVSYCITTRLTVLTRPLSHFG
jgi:hypothetical protein